MIDEQPFPGTVGVHHNDVQPGGTRVKTTCLPFGDQSTQSSLARERVRLIGLTPEGFTRNTSTAPPRFRRKAIWPFPRVSTASYESALARFIQIPALEAACCAADDQPEETFKEATSETAAIER
jgi:hypothetical protein